MRNLIDLTGLGNLLQSYASTMVNFHLFIFVFGDSQVTLKLHDVWKSIYIGKLLLEQEFFF